MEDAAVDLWATDEVHFQQHGSRCRMWVPPETKDPVLRHHPTRRSVGYFGAVRLRDGEFQFSRETGKFNAVTFFTFLKGLRRTSIRTGRRSRAWSIQRAHVTIWCRVYDRSVQTAPDRHV